MSGKDAETPKKSWLDTIAVYFQFNILLIFMMGIASGFPLLLTSSTLAARLTESGVDIKTIGVFALVGLPYTFKFLLAFFVDAIHFPWAKSHLAHRKTWCIFAQLLLTGALFGMSAIDPAQNTLLLGIFALLTASFSAMQDIVIDALRVEMVTKDTQGAAAAASVAGYRIGMLMAGAGAFVLATYFPWDRVYLIGAGVMLACIPITLAVRKLKGVEEASGDSSHIAPQINKKIEEIKEIKEKQLNRKEVEASIQEQINSDSLTFEQLQELENKQREQDKLEAIELKKVEQLEHEVNELLEQIEDEPALSNICEPPENPGEHEENVIPDADSIDPAQPLNADSSDPAQPSNKENFFVTSIIRPLTDFFQRPGAWIILLFIALFKLGDAMAGTLSVPFYLDIGFTKIQIAAITKVIGVIAVLGGTFLGGFVVKKLPILKALWFCGILQLLSNFVFVWLAQIGASVPALTVCICVENVTGGMGTAAFVAYISQLCNVRFTATQYALLSSLSTVGRTVFSSSAGVIVDVLGWSGFYISTAVLAVPGLCMLYWIGIIEKKNAGRIEG